jgi:hypothetical protein
VVEAEKARRVTLLRKYSADNVFAKGSTLYEQVREASKANARPLYGQDNPFSKLEVQAKVRTTLQARYGVGNPNQSPTIRAKITTRNLERYGVGESLAAPEIRGKIAATNQERYGGASPSCSPEVVERARQTNLKRWGVEWTAQHPEIRQRQLQTVFENYGGHFFASDRGQAEIKAILIERYGADHPSRIAGFWDKTVATFLRKYGAEHPLLLAEFLDKRRGTCQARYGVDNPLQNPDVYARLVDTVRAKYGVDCVFQAESVKEKARETNSEKYGVPHPMLNQEYALQRLERMRRPGPNFLERQFGKHNPELLYTGDGSFWRWLPGLKHHKNPDFILPGPDPKDPKRGVTHVVEVFGDFWHSRHFTGRESFDHEAELISAYAEIGLSCLIVWESEFKKDPDGVRTRVVGHLGDV